MSLSLASSTQPNLAPEKGVTRSVQDRRTDTSVLIETDWFLSTRKKLEGENSPTWKNQNLLWQMIFHMCEGRQLLRRARYGGGWRTAPLPESTDSPVYSLNIIGFYSDNIKAKWTQSNTKILWRPVSDTDQAQGSAKAASKVDACYTRKLYTQTFRQIEATLAQCGKYARYYYYTDEAKSYARRPVIGTEQLGFGEGSWFCADCGSGGELGGAAGNMAALGSGEGSPGYGGIVPSQGMSDSSLYPMGQGLGDSLEAAQGRFNPNTASRGTAPDAGVLPATLPQGGINGRGTQLAGVNGTVSPELYGGDFAGMPGTEPGGDPFAAGYAGGGMGAGSQGEFLAGRNGVCPSCESPNVEVTETEPLEVSSIQGYEEYEHGDIVCEAVPAFELKHDLTLSPQDSPYLIRRRRVRTSVLESKFDFLKIRPAKSDNTGLQAEDNLKKSTYGATTSYTGVGDVDDEETTDFIQVWLSPCMYSRLVLKDGFRTLDGNEIPAQTRLADIFPDGLYMCFIEGIEGCVELRNECHKDYWVGQVYRIRANSSLGTGVEDMIEGQRQYNLVMSIIYTQLRTSAMPPTLYDQRLLPGGTSSYLGSLKNIPVEMGALKDKRLSDAVHQLMPQPPTQAHFSYSQQLDYFSQKASRITDVGFGTAMGREGDTATQAELAAAQQQGLFAPQLALKAEVDRRGAEIILALFKQHCFDEVYISLSGKRGEMDGQWLKAGDIAVELFAEVVADSYLPQTNLERRKRWEGFLAIIGGLPGYQALQSQNPALLEQLSELFDVDTGGEDYSAAAELCRLRIDQMGEAVPQLQIAMQGMPMVQMGSDPVSGEMVPVPVDPMAEAGNFLLGVLLPPVEPEELGHLAAINYCRNWLTTDEGREAPQELRAGVKAMIYAHVNGLMAEAQLTGMIGLAGDPMVTAPQEAPGDESKNKNPKISGKPSREAKQDRKQAAMTA